MTTFRPDGFRTVSGALEAGAGAIEAQAAHSLARLGLASWHPQPSQGFEHFRAAWSGQLHAIAGELRSLGESARTVADLLAEDDAAVGSALTPEP